MVQATRTDLATDAVFMTFLKQYRNRLPKTEKLESIERTQGSAWNRLTDEEAIRGVLFAVLSLLHYSQVNGFVTNYDAIKQGLLDRKLDKEGTATLATKLIQAEHQMRGAQLETDDQAEADKYYKSKISKILSSQAPWWSDLLSAVQSNKE